MALCYTNGTYGTSHWGKSFGNYLVYGPHRPVCPPPKVSSVDASCPHVQLIVPPGGGPYVYEARLSQALELANYDVAECGCVAGSFPWSSPGVCPRGVAYTLSGTAIDNGVARSGFFSVDAVEQVSFVSVDNAVFSALPISLYRVEKEISGKARLMADSGCPDLRNKNAQGVRTWPLSYYNATTVTFDPTLQNKWCVVKADEASQAACNIVTKYRTCWASGGIGLLVYRGIAGVRESDAHLIIRLYDAELENNTAIPVVLATNLPTDMENELLAERGDVNGATAKVEVQIGPNIGGSAMGPNPFVSPGGLRVVDMFTGQQVAHHLLFGAVNYVEPSEVRDVIFVCTDPFADDGAVVQPVVPGGVRNPIANYTSAKKIRVFSTVRTHFPQQLREFVPQEGSTRPECVDLSGRDYHVVDFKRGDRYYSTFITRKTGNKIQVYDTTNLHSWHLVKEIVADWEAGDSGLGAVRFLTE